MKLITKKESLTIKVESWTFTSAGVCAYRDAMCMYKISCG